MMDGTHAAGQIRAGRLRALSVTTAQRSDSFPGVPTMQESGLPASNSPWWAAHFPKGTPQDIVDKFAGWLLQVVKLPETANSSRPSAPYSAGRRRQAGQCAPDVGYREVGPDRSAANIQPQ